MQKIKFFLIKLFLSLKHFFKQLDEGAQAAIKEAVKIVNVIKDWTGTHEEMINFITSIIPGNIDNVIVDKLRAFLKNVNFSTLVGDERKIFLHALSIQISLVLADGKLSFNDVVYLVQWYYDNHKTTTPDKELNAELLQHIDTANLNVPVIVEDKSNEDAHAALMDKFKEIHGEDTL